MRSLGTYLEETLPELTGLACWSESLKKRVLIIKSKSRLESTCAGLSPLRHVRGICSNFLVQIKTQKGVLPEQFGSFPDLTVPLLHGRSVGGATVRGVNDCRIVNSTKESGLSLPSS